MQHWTKRRWASLIIHSTFVLIPFAWSTISAYAFWRAMFNDDWLPVPMVGVIEVLALTGLVLHIARIDSPFKGLRHLLPFISIVPLGRELYLLLAHNGWLLAGTLTVVVSAILVYIAWQCFTTIERLFIPPEQAAREQARERLQWLATRSAESAEISGMLYQFAFDVLQAQQATATDVQLEDASPQLATQAPQLADNLDASPPRKVLTDLQTTVLQLRGEGLSNSEIGKRVGKSGERVRQILKEVQG